MAVNRIVRATIIRRGVTPTAIDGAVGFSVSSRFGLADDISDGAVGPTIQEPVSLEISGTIIVRDTTEPEIINLIMGDTPARLLLQWKAEGGATQERAIDAVIFTSIGPLAFPSGRAEGETSLIAIRWRAVLASGDVTPATVMAVGAAA